MGRPCTCCGRDTPDEDDEGGGAGIIPEDCGEPCIDGEAPEEFRVVISADSYQHVDFCRDGVGDGCIIDPPWETLDKYCNDVECQDIAGTYILTANSTCNGWCWSCDLVWPYMEVLGKPVHYSGGSGTPGGGGPCQFYRWHFPPIPAVQVPSHRMKLLLGTRHYDPTFPTNYFTSGLMFTIDISHTYPTGPTGAVGLSRWNYDFVEGGAWGYENEVDCLNFEVELDYVFGRRTAGDCTSLPDPPYTVTCLEPPNCACNEENVTVTVTALL